MFDPISMFLETLKDNEYQWVLEHEVKRTLKDLQNILAECIVKFPVAITEEVEGTGGARNNLKIPDMEKFVLTAPSTSPSDQVTDFNSKPQLKLSSSQVLSTD